MILDIVAHPKQLRLLNPAIMRPHLFDLRNGQSRYHHPGTDHGPSAELTEVGLLPPGPRRTATLLARVMSSMSFFTPRDAPRDPELALFVDLIRANSDIMLDYLSTFAAPPEPIQPERSTAGTDVGLTRPAMLPENQSQTVPVTSPAGPIDLQAEAAVLSATLYQRRMTTYVRPDEDGLSADLLLALRDLDENLRVLHGPAHSDDDTPPDDDFANPHRSARQFSRLDRPPDQDFPLPASSSTRLTPDNSHSSSTLVFRTPPVVNDEMRGEDKYHITHRERAGAFVRRSLSGKGLRRRGSLPGLRIRPVGREADDSARPKTARR